MENMSLSVIFDALKQEPINELSDAVAIIKFLVKAKHDKDWIVVVKHDWGMILVNHRKEWYYRDLEFEETEFGWILKKVHITYKKRG